MNRILCICYEFPPQVTPTALGTGAVLAGLRQSMKLDVITANSSGYLDGDMNIQKVPEWTWPRMTKWIFKLRLGRVVELLSWPDRRTGWIIPAVVRAAKCIKEHRPDAIAVFMMPYSAGLVGLLLKRRYGIPLILNLDDSPTCSDMHEFPTRLHYLLSRRLEDAFVAAADRIIYVSQLNLDRNRDRASPEDRKKFHLVRFGNDPSPIHIKPADPGRFRIVYTGGMVGWIALAQSGETPNPWRAARRALMQAGQYRLTPMDYKTHSPCYVGRALLAVIRDQPAWKGRLQVAIYGSTAPSAIVDRALRACGVAEVVCVNGAVTNAEARDLAANADLLFMCLPNRLDGTPGGRISAKTYEYLSTDRPILAALPPGENREYLSDKPGVFLVAPDDVDAMAEVISKVAAASFDGMPLRFDRSSMLDELSNARRALQFEEIVRSVLARS